MLQDLGIGGEHDHDHDHVHALVARRRRRSEIEMADEQGHGIYKRAAALASDGHDHVGHNHSVANVNEVGAISHFRTVFKLMDVSSAKADGGGGGGHPYFFMAGIQGPLKGQLGPRGF